MAKGRLFQILSRLTEVKPGEEKIALLLFFYFFLIMFPYYIIKPVRDAKFLIEEGSLHLPVAYLLTAISMGIFVHLYSKLQVSIPKRVLVTSSLIFFMLTCFISAVLFRNRVAWMPYAFWVWANVFVTVLLTQFWMMINDIFNPREARRLIGFLGSGGILGSFFGAVLTGYLGRKYPDSLLYIAAGVLILVIGVLHFIFSWQKRNRSFSAQPKTKGKTESNEKTKVGFKDSFDTVRKNAYLKLLAAVVTVTFVVSAFIDYQSKTVIEYEIERIDKMTRFFGYFHAALLIFPFFLQLLMTSNLIRRLGIRVTLMIYPFLLFLGTLLVGFHPVLFSAVIIKASDKSLSFSLNQSVRELLYIPISPEIKYKAKLFIDMFLTRFAKGIGALVLMVFIFMPRESQERVMIVSFITIVFILAWIFLNWKVSQEYTNTVKQKLEMKWDRADRLVAQQVDLDYAKLVFDTIESRNRSSVLYAMHLFDLIKKDRLTPEVRKLISYKSDEVRVSSFGPLVGSDATPIIPEPDEFLDEETLSKEVGEIMSLSVYQEVMKSYLESVLKRKGSESETARMELAKAIGWMDSRSPLAENLEDLLWDESPDISKYALESASRLRKKEHVPVIIRKLASPFTREDASSALEAYGPTITGTLLDYLRDSTEEIELRRGAAAVLARIGTQDAASFLTMELAKDRPDIDTEIVDALDRIHSERSDIQFQRDIIKAKILSETERHYRLVIDLFHLQSSGKQEKARILEKSSSLSLMNIFKLLGLIYAREDILKAYQNIKTGRKDSVAYGLELLDNILEKEMRDRIFPLVEELTLEERAKRCISLQRTFPDS